MRKEGGREEEGVLRAVARKKRPWRGGVCGRKRWARSLKRGGGASIVSKCGCDEKRREGEGKGGKRRGK